MVLGKRPVPGRPTYFNFCRARASVLAVCASGGCLDIFSFVYHFSSVSSVWETTR